jgi:leucine dehydrogenase
VLEDLIRRWGGEEVVVGYDEPSGSWMFVCIHSTRLGPAGGGTRMKSYAEPSDALQDAMNLSEAMTLKMAAAGIPFGGGKAVIAVPRLPSGDERRRLLLRYAELASSLGETFHTGPDVNTSTADMDLISERHAHVYCRSPENGGSGDPGPYTARGVYHGLRASVRHAVGSDLLKDCTVLVQGVGDVGAPLAELVAADGAHVLVSDIDSERASALAARIGADVVAPEDALDVECDVYAPCALGGTLDADSIPRLRCRVVAGSANNQLHEREDSDRLRDAGILYAPDFVINAGGLINVYNELLGGYNRERALRMTRGIYLNLTRVFETAKRESITTAVAADHVAEERIATVRKLGSKHWGRLRAR